jgi:hypothetical protein
VGVKLFLGLPNICNVTGWEESHMIETSTNMKWGFPQQLDLPKVYLMQIHVNGLDQTVFWAFPMGCPDLSMGRTIELGTIPWS